VIVIPGFFEGRTLSSVLDPALSEVLFAPVLRYGMPGELVVAPGILDREAEDYMERLVLTRLRNQRRFLLVGQKTSESFHDWLEGRCRGLGFTDRLYGNYSGVDVFLFERGP
jgi:hypothetical protein